MARRSCKGVDLDVVPGEIFVIMGPSGSGKTVLLKHIIGLEKPDEGEILIDGQALHRTTRSWNDTAWPWSFSPARCFNSLTVGENVGTLS